MKTLASLCVAFCFATASAYAASAAYDFSTLDIAVPDHPEMVAYPDDINDKGEILSNIRINNLTEALITGQPTNRRNTKFKGADSMFSCTGVAGADTRATSINSGGSIAGYCVNATVTKQFGFVRNPDGSRLMLDFPGADGTGAFGISDGGKVTGQFYGPLRTD